MGTCVVRRLSCLETFATLVESSPPQSTVALREQERRVRWDTDFDWFFGLHNVEGCQRPWLGPAQRLLHSCHQRISNFSQRSVGYIVLPHIIDSAEHFGLFERFLWITKRSLLNHRHLSGAINHACWRRDCSPASSSAILGDVDTDTVLAVGCTLFSLRLYSSWTSDC